MQRSTFGRRSTHCGRGHLRTKENCYERRRGDRVYLECRTCTHEFGDSLEVRRQKDKARYAADPEKWQAMHRRYYAKHKTKTLARNWVRQIGKLGCTPDRYERMFTKQSGHCKICGKTQARKLAVDHDHETGTIRGLLCSTCNTGLGCFGDSVDGLRNALEYLQCHIQR
jgi:hypothetical protein